MIKYSIKFSKNSTISNHHKAIWISKIKSLEASMPKILIFWIVITLISTKKGIPKRLTQCAREGYFGRKCKGKSIELKWVSKTHCFI